MQTLLDLFANFPANGNRTALVYRTGVRRFMWSYRELYDLSLKMSSWLADHGVGRGDRVVLWAPSNPWWVVAFWGVVARGGVVVPVDFASGRERAKHIAELTEARLVIQSRYKLDRLGDETTYRIEDLEYVLPDLAPADRLATVKPSDTAEIIYTSGTTGDPKGVVLSHGNLMANLTSVNEHITITSSFTFLSLLPLSHMFEQMGGFFTPLYRGGKIVYLRTLKPSAIMEALATEGITTVMIVPRLLQALCNGIEREFAARHLGGAFRWLLAFMARWPLGFRRMVFYPVRRTFGPRFLFFVSGGASLDLELAKFWQALGFVIVEGYGLTVCSPILTANTPVRQVLGSVGIAVPGVELKIEGNELLARGPNVFSAYYHNPKATREVFTANGWFKTGDLATIDGAGNVFLRGRQKEVVVTAAGMNVYPDDIEPTLNKLAGVREGCIIGLDTGSGEEVHAVLILDGSGRTPEDIIYELDQKLDPLQQVTGFTIWPEAEFPKTTTLKIQKYRVRERFMRGGSTAGSATQDKLVTLVSKVTGKPTQEITKNSVLTIDLGLTSIARLELVNCLEQEYRLDMDDSAITQHTTVADLRRMITSRDVQMERVKYRWWITGRAVRLLRKVADGLLQEHIFRHFVELRGVGVEHVSHLGEPAIFVANHLSYFDAPAILYALPPHRRYRIAVAVGDEFFFSPGGGPLKRLVRRLMYEYVSLFWGAFILPEKAGFRQASAFMGKLIDGGVSILYFPEGGMRREDKELPYQLGIGLLAQELKVLVVPVRLEGLGAIINPDTAALKRGEASVIFGRPLRFTSEKPSEIVSKIQKAIETLK